jgi:CheY-like chemotaxis protein
MTSKGSILAVDDTPASLRLLTDILKSEGYEVRSAINGELALHAAAAQLPELILLDVSMPGMSGFGLPAFEGAGRTRDVPVTVSAMETLEK